jgi:CHAT domain-containing protein
MAKDFASSVVKRIYSLATEGEPPIWLQRLCLLTCLLVFTLGAGSETWQRELNAGMHAREVGATYDSIWALEAAVKGAPDSQSRTRALTQLGLTLTQAGRLADAESILQSAYRQATEQTRYSIALALGNVASRAHDRDRAAGYYQEVISSTGGGDLAGDARIAAELNLIGLRPASERLPLLEQLVPRLEDIKNSDRRARAFYGMAAQADEALASMRLPLGNLNPMGPATADTQILRPKNYDRLLELSYSGFAKAQQLAEQSGDGLLAVDALDSLAQLYESEGRFTEAAEINRRALQSTAGLTLGQVEFAQVRLEWRAARLQHRRGDDSSALASYLRAAGHLGSIRQDLPIEDASGKSTYQTLQRPLFVGLADLTLKNVDSVSADQQQARLASALDVIEQTHQAELQDYLGDRCSVDSVSQATIGSVAPAMAVVYPVVLRDRLEVIVRTHNGLLHHAAPVTAAVLGNEIQNLRSELLDAGSRDFLRSSRKLYGWLLEPFEQELANANVQELIIVPDGYLRLIPVAALHDGNQFMAERYLISTVTGLTMTEPSAPRGKRPMSLLAGLSNPGPVVDRLMAMGFKGSTELTANATSRGLLDPTDHSVPGGEAVSQAMSLRTELALPGVRTEIHDLTPLARSRSLLDGEFTVERFTREIQSGNYQVVHVASHGFFGRNSDQSFLLAYDNIIKLDDLQRLMAAHGNQIAGIDLLTLSACDTATGDDRAPLGFAGAAIKARARSVIGTRPDIRHHAESGQARRRQSLLQLPVFQCRHGGDRAVLHHQRWDQ